MRMSIVGRAILASEHALMREYAVELLFVWRLCSSRRCEACTRARE